MTGQTRADLDDVVWARRTLAIALRTEGGTANLDAALALVEENLKSRPSSVLDLRTKAMILADDADPARRDTARQILEHLIRDRAGRGGNTPYAGSNVSGRRQLDLLALPHLRLATDPSTISRYVQGMLDRSQLDEAELGLARLAELCLPSQVRCSAVAFSLPTRRTRTCARRDRCTRRCGARPHRNRRETFSGQRPWPRSSPDIHLGPSRRRLPPPAGKGPSLPATAAPLGSDEEMDLVAFLARDGQAEEALKMVEQNMDSASVPAIARGIASFAEAKRLDDQTRQHLNAIIESAIAAHGRPLELLM